MINKNTLQLIEDLLEFNTVSSNSNQPLIDYINEYLTSFNIPTYIIKSKNKKNLIAHIGPASAPAIVVSGHTDVVPANSSQWNVTSPFAPKIFDGRLYGRGSADMKSFIGIALSKLGPLHGKKLKNSVILAFSFDEEIGCLGVPSLIKYLSDLNKPLVGCLIGEPTNMAVGTAHKGHIGLRATVTGKGGHSGFPDLGINAIDFAVELASYLNKVSLEMRDASELDLRFKPPYSTVHTGFISGGTALNKIPELCTVDFEMRCLPHHNSMLFLNNIDEFLKNKIKEKKLYSDMVPSVDIDVLNRYPQLNEKNEIFIKWISKLADFREQPVALGFGTEAGLFAELGIPVVVCGPGSIHQAHLPDEYIELEQIMKGECFFDNLINDLHTGLKDFQ